MRASNKHLVQIALISNIFQWYGFCVAAFLAATIGQVFFTQQNSIVATIISFAVFAISYLVRPLGSILFGYIGDQFSSGVALKHSMIMMMLPTLFIGLLPSYQTAGSLASALLILLSIVQGIAAGGALPLSASYVFEHSKNRTNRAFLCSLVSAGAPLGILTASIVTVLLYTNFSHVSVIAWAWRLPFILSIPMAIMVLYFGKHINLEKTAIFSCKIMYKNYIKSFLKAILLTVFLQISMYVLLVWLPTYLEYFMKISYLYARISNMIALAVYVICIVFFGYIEKFICYKYLILICVILLSGTIYPLFLLLHGAEFITLALVQSFFAVLIAMLYGGYFFALNNMFDSNIRNKAMAIVFTVPTAIFGGSAPVVCGYFIHKFDIMFFPCFYIIVFGILAIPALLTI
ncbi:MAG: MFS transporter [Burkholderiales bacterium]|nr:MFS transporter [Burkholderiales bacterium]